MIPERSSAALSAKSVFFEEYNDIDIYIEDTAVGYVKLFTEIFSRLFEGEYRISNVYPLGGRSAVIEECERWQGEVSRPSLYIIDGDMYLLTKEEKAELDGLYILPMYCIENILIDEAALIELLNEEETIKLKNQLKTEFNFEDWLTENISILTNLFIEYAVCFDLCPEIQTVAYPVSNLVSSKMGELDVVKVNRRIEELKNQIISIAGEEVYYQRREVFFDKVDSCTDSICKYISGKDYLMPLMLTRARSMVRTKIPNLNFKLRLAMKCDLNPIAECKNYIVG